MNTFRPMHNRTVSLSLACVALVATAFSTFARPVPQNLGNGLDKLVESNLTLKGRLAAPAADAAAKPDGTAVVQGRTVKTYQGYATQQAANYARAAIVDSVAN